MDDFASLFIVTFSSAWILVVEKELRVNALHTQPPSTTGTGLRLTESTRVPGTRNRTTYKYEMDDEKANDP
jgi:hypothetical protein